MIFPQCNWLYLLSATALFCGHSLAANVSVGNWSPLFQGISQTTAMIDGPDASVAYALRVDTTAPGIGFYTTPPSGSLNTVSETTSQFLERSGAQVAMNANFFAPCCDAFPEDKTVIGLAVSNGVLVAPASGTPGESNVALLISQRNVASIMTTTANMNLANVYNAVAGSAMIVQNGTNIGALSPNEGDPTNPNPRTDVGLSQDSRFLYLVTIDGRQPGYSVGTTIPETADILIALGAYTAMNLDGGGSTVMVQSDGNGGAIDINHPSGGTERYDADSLGIFAQPLATPEPASFGMVVVAGLLLVIIGKSGLSLTALARLRSVLNNHAPAWWH